MSGKGSAHTRVDFKKYGKGLFWKRSKCCNARLMTDNENYLCAKCGKVTTPKKDD